VIEVTEASLLTAFVLLYGQHFGLLCFLIYPPVRQQHKIEAAIFATSASPARRVQTQLVE
jgi:hypothetical protein